MSRTALKNITQLIKQANNELPIEQSFINDLKRSIEITTQKSSREPSRTYKPSSMNCIRNMYYQVVGAEQDEGNISYQGINICNVGTDIHERIQKYIDGMKENGIDCEYIDVAEYVKTRRLDLEIVAKSGMETKLYHKGLNMSFMCDGIIRYKGKYYIVEIKTEGSWKFKQRIGVDYNHYNQGTAYSIAFDIDEVIFIYINRDTLEMKSFMFNVPDERKEKLIGTITICDEYVNKQSVPPKPEDIDKKKCAYCGYAKRCREDN